VTKPDAYPIPNITVTLDSLGTSRIFSVLDMASGYHQIGVQEEDKEKPLFHVTWVIISLRNYLSE
jgi:hypothetical protein